MSPAPELAALEAGVLAGDPVRLGQAISLVEDSRPARRALGASLLQGLARRGGGAAAVRVGVTGPPGAGKSTLVWRLVQEARARGLRVGVLAVDPSSPRSGGALLGDRARITFDPHDHGVFVRSMASGGDLGGLARAAGAAVEVLAAAFPLVLIETVGVGQSETDVEHLSDVVVLVVQPASGDTLQFIKAGILEIPDVLVVNKADLGAVADRALAELGAALGAVHAGGRAVPRAPVLRASAATGEGTGALLDTCLALHAAQLADASLTARRQRAELGWALRVFRQEWGDRGVRRAGGPAALTERLRQLRAQGLSLGECVERAGEG